jgi:hypothetical protein
MTDWAPLRSIKVDVPILHTCSATEGGNYLDANLFNRMPTWKEYVSYLKIFLMVTLITMITLAMNKMHLSWKLADFFLDVSKPLLFSILFSGSRNNFKTEGA